MSGILQAIGPIEVRTRTYRKLEHMGTAIPAFEDDVRFVGAR